MSVVTNVILVCSLSDSGFNESMTMNHRHIIDDLGLARVDDYGGGNKAIQGAIYIGAFNYLDRDKMIEKLRSYNWEIPVAVQIMFHGEWDDRYKVTNVFPDAPPFN